MTSTTMSSSAATASKMNVLPAPIGPPIAAPGSASPLSIPNRGMTSFFRNVFNRLKPITSFMLWPGFLNSTTSSPSWLLMKPSTFATTTSCESLARPWRTPLSSCINACNDRPAVNSASSACVPQSWSLRSWLSLRANHEMKCLRVSRSGDGTSTSISCGRRAMRWFSCDRDSAIITTESPPLTNPRSQNQS